MAVYPQPSGANNNYRPVSDRIFSGEIKKEQQEALTARQSSSENVLNGPVALDNSYQFGDWITGRMANKQSQSNQAALDYAEWVRNENSAQNQRAWEEYMSNTQVQRSMRDLEAAGLNPLLAVEKAGFGGVVPAGSAASSSAGQVASSGSSPGAAIAGAAIGSAALIKSIAKLVKVVLTKKP